MDTTTSFPRRTPGALADRAGCLRCGRFVTHYVVIDGDRRCLACIDAVPADGTLLIGGLPPWELADWDWFCAHRPRRLRLRKPWPGELFMLGYYDARERIAAAACAGLEVLILVEQFGGQFARAAASFRGGDAPDNDAGIEALLGRDT